MEEAKHYFAYAESKRETLLSEIKRKDHILHRIRVLSPIEPISSKMRSCFFLRTESTDEAALVLLEVVSKQGESVLLRHEAAYCLGQMKRTIVVESLQTILLNIKDDAIVRHECAEALGSIGDMSCIPVLLKAFIDPLEPSREVRETCEIALDRFRFLAQEQEINEMEDEFNTIDPAIVRKTKRTPHICELEADLMDHQSSLYERYQAMFSLRRRSMNGKTEKEKEDAVLVLCRALLDTSQGSLYRHEVAFVLGQISHPASVPTLAIALADLTLHDMVRHECAEALGGVGTEEAIKLLVQYEKSPNEAQIVKESCQVALDAVEYWTTFGSS